MGKSASSTSSAASRAGEGEEPVIAGCKCLHWPGNCKLPLIAPNCWLWFSFSRTGTANPHLRALPGASPASQDQGAFSQAPKLGNPNPTGAEVCWPQMRQIWGAKQTKQHCRVQKKNPLGSDVPILGGLGGLKPLVAMGTLTPGQPPSRAQQRDRFLQPLSVAVSPAPLRGSALPREGFGRLLAGDAAEEKEKLSCLPVPATAQQGQPAVWHGACSSYKSGLLTNVRGPNPFGAAMITSPDTFFFFLSFFYSFLPF